MHMMYLWHRRMAQLEQWTNVGIKERENSKIVFCLGTSDLKKKKKPNAKLSLSIQVYF